MRGEVCGSKGGSIAASRGKDPVWDDEDGLLFGMSLLFEEGGVDSSFDLVDALLRAAEASFLREDPTPFDFFDALSERRVIFWGFRSVQKFKFITSS